MSLIQEVRSPGREPMHIEWVTSSFYHSIAGGEAYGYDTHAFTFCNHGDAKSNMVSCGQFRYPERMLVERLTIAIFDYERLRPTDRCTDARVQFRVGEWVRWSGTLGSMDPYYEILPGEEQRLGFSVAMKTPGGSGCYIPPLQNFMCNLDGLAGWWSKLVCVIAGQYGHEVA